MMIAKMSNVMRTALLVSALAVAGCTEVMTSAEPDIVQVAQSAGTFDTLVTAVGAADLTTTLQGDGPFTVFAPTDDAFAALPAGTVESLLLPENKSQLVSVLTYHVLAGKVTAADVSGQRLSPKTVNGKSLHIDGRNGVKINDATIISADIAASDGVIHVIDKVLLP